MDRLIKRFAARPNDDLMITNRGVAYQRDMKGITFEYGESYFQHYKKLEKTKIANEINAGRVALVNKYLGSEKRVLDIGVGSGEFIKNRPNTFGYDVNPVAIDWLKKSYLWSEDFPAFEAFTFWDVLEHVDNPDRHYFRHMPDKSFLFVSMPIFPDLGRIRKSKHYKPNEHLYYFTEKGLIDWLAEYRYRLLEVQDYETRAGRDSVLSFAFQKTLPSYRDTIAQYQMMHTHGAYGITGRMHLLEMAPSIFALDPHSILDFGCGRSDLAAHFWNEGRRRIERYDPAIPEFKKMPDGPFDLVICCDVMEHIQMADVDKVFDEIWQKSRKAIFTISLIPARAELPDGRNAHVTLLSEREWMRWIGERFGEAIKIKTAHEHLLMIKTFQHGG